MPAPSQLKRRITFEHTLGMQGDGKTGDKQRVMAEASAGPAEHCHRHPHSIPQAYLVQAGGAKGLAQSHTQNQEISRPHWPKSVPLLTRLVKDLKFLLPQRYK